MKEIVGMIEIEIVEMVTVIMIEEKEVEEKGMIEGEIVMVGIVTAIEIEIETDGDVDKNK